MGICIWHEDADSFKHGDEALKIVFQNNIVRSYLSSTRILGIAAMKGQGKTFLIKTKRNNLHNSKDDNEDTTSVTCFPKDTSLVDTLNRDMVINHTIRGLLNDYRTWVSLWQFSIVAAIICSDECRKLYSSSDFIDFSDCVNYFFNRGISKDKKGQVVNVPSENIKNTKGRPSVIFSRLLGLDGQTLQQVINQTDLAVRLVDRISNGIYFFIDKVDQAFSTDVYQIKKRGNHNRSVNASHWQYCQYALADAAYNLLSYNSHIKVFYTIRQEALIDSHLLAPNTARNIESSMIELSYSKDDLYQMFKLYVENETDDCLFDGSLKKSNAERALFGFEEIPHSFVDETIETPFDYLYRHSLRRPCDLMLLCKEIYLKDPKKLNVSIFRQVINENSAKILRRYLAEVEPFITLSYENIEQLLVTINTNIFDLNYMKLVCERYNTELGNISGCRKDCPSCNGTHPFSALCNIGLLGYLRESISDSIPQQRFLPIGESKLKLNEHDIKSSDLYFLHPCLCDISRNTRREIYKVFYTCDITIVGEGVELNIEKLNLIKDTLPDYVDKLSDDKVFVSSTIADLVRERDIVRETLINLHLYPIMSEGINFQYGYDDVDPHDHCIDEMLKCKQLIYIIGNKYGNEYTGSKYRKYAEKIKEESKGKIVKPSISLLEFYVARSNSINIKMFILKNVLEEMKNNGTQIPDSQCDREVFNIVNFIKQLPKDSDKKGGWWLTFKDTEELKLLIRNQQYKIDGSHSK